MTKDNNWYLKALHWGNERYHAKNSSEPRGRLEVPSYKVMTKDNNWYLKALHWGNEWHRA
ncbi:hypothetical protein GmHk_14G041688 [Glycine max]|nr:hypothetical protein GmHk_14G041688 [Glycine max]